jgi:hypothetical protein
MSNGDPPAHPVAPTAPQTLSFPAPFRLVVRVRDAVGRPIAGATVRVTEVDPPLSQTTDPEGFAIFENVRAQGEIQVTASTADILEPRGRARAEHGAVVPAASASARVAPPSPPAASSSEGTAPATPTLFLTLFVRQVYRPYILFPWQNRVVRDEIYKARPEDSHDPGQARGATPGDASSGDAQGEGGAQRGHGRARQPQPHLLTRNDRLADTIWLYRNILPSVGLPGAASARMTEVHDRLTRERVQPVQEQIDAIDERIAAIDQELATLPPAEPTRPGRPPRQSPRERDLQRQKRALQRRRADLVRQRDQRRRQVASTEGDLQTAAAQREMRSMTHRALLEHVMRMFREDDALAGEPAADQDEAEEGATPTPRGRLIPLWVRYMILHFTGLHYHSAHGTHWPPALLLERLRKREIDALPALSGDTLDLAVGEILELFHANTGWVAPVERALRELRTPPPQPRGGGGTAPAPPARSAPPAPQTTDLNADLRGVASWSASRKAQWIKEIEVAITRALGKPPAPPLRGTEVDGLYLFGGRPIHAPPRRRRTRRGAPAAPAPAPVGPPPPRLEMLEGLAALIARRAEALSGTARRPGGNDPFADLLWRRIVKVTPLRDQFAETPAWYTPPSIPGSDRWNSAVLTGSVTREWKFAHERDLRIVTPSAVCNEITEMAGHARFLRLSGGIEADSRADALEVVADQGPALGGHRLFRLRAVPSASTPPDERPLAGDLMFVMGWRRIGATDEPWSVVRATLPVQYRAWELRRDDPLGFVPEQERNPPSRDSITLDITGGSNVALAVSDDQLFTNATAAPPALSAGQAPPSPHLFGIAHYRSLQSDALSGGRWSIGQIVRRHPNGAKFDQQLVWTHIGTVAYADDTRLLTFETNAPTSIRRRGYRELMGWQYVFGRPAINEDRPELEDLYLLPDNLFGPLED